MSTDELQVLEYLKGFPEQFVSAREIARTVGGKRRYREEPDWAKPVLKRLLNKDLIETDSMNGYRIKPEDDQRQSKFHLAPHIAEILRKSGRKFGGVGLADSNLTGADLTDPASDTEAGRHGDSGDGPAPPPANR